MDWHDFYQLKVDKFSLKDYLNNLLVHVELFESIVAENPKKILEIGSGTGTMSIFLSHLGYEVVSIDNDPRVLQIAKDLSKRLNGHLVFKKANAFKLDFPNKYFDLAFHQGFFEHFTDQEIERLLDEQLRVAKVVVFSVPNNFYRTKDFGDERLLSKEEWQKILSNYKLKESFDYRLSQRKIDRLLRKIFKIEKKTMYLAKIIGKK